MKVNLLRYTFVLLHFNNVEVTCKAIQYIRSLNTESGEVNIVVVNNGSSNNSGIILDKQYGSEGNVVIIHNEKNIGFAKGNNIGYLYAIEHYKPDFVILMNTDIFIYDVEFLNILSSFYSDDVEIIAPDIITKNGIHQNPDSIYIISNLKMLSIYAYNTIISLIYKIPIVSSLAVKFLDKRNRLKIKNATKINVTMYDIVPHGSCLIYTKKWIRNERIAFVPDTFMYFEENILMDYIVSHDYHTVYFPKLIVHHLEDASINSFKQVSLEKRKFVSNNMRKSVCFLMKKRLNDRIYKFVKLLNLQKV